MTTATIHFVLCVCFLMMCVISGMSQTNKEVRFSVTSTDYISPRKTHVGVTDMRVDLRIDNKSSDAACVYGNQQQDEFEPFFYLLRYDEKEAKWFYPTADRRPLSHEKLIHESGDLMRLSPGKSLAFSVFPVRKSFVQKLKIAVFMGCDVSKEAVVLFSEEFSIPTAE